MQSPTAPCPPGMHRTAPRLVWAQQKESAHETVAVVATSGHGEGNGCHPCSGFSKVCMQWYRPQTRLGKDYPPPDGSRSYLSVTYIRFCTICNSCVDHLKVIYQPRWPQRGEGGGSAALVVVFPRNCNVVDGNNTLGALDERASSGRQSHPPKSKTSLVPVMHRSTGLYIRRTW